MGSRNEIVLTDWHLRPHAKDQVLVEGVRKVGKKEEMWHSSCIVNRLTRNRVQTSSGSVYVLKGDHDIESTLEYGYKKSTAWAFAAGFPKDWQVVLELKKKPSSKKRSSRQVLTKIDVNQFDSTQKGKAVSETHLEEQLDTMNQLAEKSVATSKPLDTKDQQVKKLVSKSARPRRKGEESEKANEQAVGVDCLPRTRRRGLRHRDDNFAYKDVSSSEEEGEEFLVSKAKGKKRFREDDYDSYSEGSEDSEVEENDDGWSKKECKLLREAHASVPVGPINFWKRVAKLVPGRSKEECYEKWHSTYLKSKGNVLDKAKAKKKDQSKKSKLFKKPAGRDTARFRTQVREMFEDCDGENNDNLFDATPFRSRKPTRTTGVDISFPTPVAKGGDEIGDDGSSESEEESRRVDREKTDHYIAGIAKRYKGKQKRKLSAAAFS
eukprot:CAMPEP_0203750446 /NCGR_PEP_ID=MMETSP0098-20131031/4668_1 /ASSEMBLY_ACC=CAM_ASM_000208 /TAXON_ID=96639 /ORGANISM=" , Strain NY0313808BC1" /LENGTH=435 /DNA_ID=CAMNT_0050639731 /DNA_START=924 /DNA_END=2227 /DNA_ORIENTATION=-